MLDTQLQGFKAQIDPGGTFHGDGKSLHAAAGWGTRLFSDRAHLLVGAEYTDDDGIGDCASKRDWCGQSYNSFTNAPPGTNGQPNFVIGPNARASNETVNGVFPFVQPFAPTLANRQFNAEGTALSPYNPGLYVTSPLNFSFFGNVQGGDSGISPYDVVTIRPPVQTTVGFAHLDFDATETLQPFVEVSYGRREASNRQFTLGPTLASIQRDNAYLPASIAAQIGDIAPGVPGFAFFNTDVSSYVRQENSTLNETWRGVVGGERGIRITLALGCLLPERQERAGTDARESCGQWHGWPVQLPRMGTGRGAAAQRQRGLSRHPAGTGLQRPRRGLRAAESLRLRKSRSGSDCLRVPYAGGGLRVRPARGGIQRARRRVPGFRCRPHRGRCRRRISQRPGRGHAPAAHHSLLQRFRVELRPGFSGKIQVVEGYAEVNVPLLRDRPGVRLLEVDGAVRQTRNRATDELLDESRSQNITTWKLSAAYQPLDWVRLRATRSKDIRAAGFRELFSKTVLTVGGAFGTVVNPWRNNLNEPTSIQGGGSFDLEPEDATTTTAGLVFQFQELGLQFSADWYEVEIEDAITSPTANQLALNCYTSNTFCDRINNGVDPDTIGGAITFVDTRALNLNQFITRGVDFEAAYRVPFNIAGGALNVRMVTSYLYDFIVAGVNYAGQTDPPRRSVTSTPRPAGRVLSGPRISAGPSRRPRRSATSRPGSTT